MDILDKVKQIRLTVMNRGKYRVIAEESGVGYQWLTKFASGVIQNPTVINIAKLETYFKM